MNELLGTKWYQLFADGSIAIFFFHENVCEMRYEGKFVKFSYTYDHKKLTIFENGKVLRTFSRMGDTKLMCNNGDGTFDELTSVDSISGMYLGLR